MKIPFSLISCAASLYAQPFSSSELIADSLTHFDLSHNLFSQVPRALFDLPPETEIDFRGNPLPPEEIAAVREALAQRRAAGLTAQQIIFTEHDHINDDNALQLAAQDGLNVHTAALTESFKRRLDTLIAQFPEHFQGDLAQQHQEMRDIQQRLIASIELYAKDNPDKESALNTARAMFEKAYGQRAEYFNDFKYSSGRVLFYVMLAMEAQWQRTPVAHRVEAQVNGMKELSTLLAEGKDFCDTRHIEEVLQMISLPLSRFAQEHPEVVGNMAAVPPSPDQVRDITFPLAQRVLREIEQQQPAFEGEAFRVKIADNMRADHPAISSEQLDAYLQ